MTAPTLVYSTASNGKRIVTVDGIKIASNNTVAPSGTHDVKNTPAGIKLLSVAGDLPEPLDVAEMRGRI